MSTLIIKDLYVTVGEKEILKGINLTINTGEIHAIMGPNGNGKSTLLSTIMGHPKYVVTQGEILLDGQDVLSMSVDERARSRFIFRYAISSRNTRGNKFRFS